MPEMVGNQFIKRYFRLRRRMMKSPIIAAAALSASLSMAIMDDALVAQSWQPPFAWWQGCAEGCTEYDIYSVCMATPGSGENDEYCVSNGLEFCMSMYMEWCFWNGS
jgi:hypothetical protein